MNTTTIKFNDLMFNSELIELDIRDIKQISYNKADNTFMIQNVDGLYYKSEANKDITELYKTLTEKES